VAYESRFQAERDLIYAVRDYESFRRSLTVAIAGDYFNLQQLRQGSSTPARAFAPGSGGGPGPGALGVGWQMKLDVQRAEQDRLNAVVNETNAMSPTAAAWTGSRSSWACRPRRRLTSLPRDRRGLPAGRRSEPQQPGRCPPHAGGSGTGAIEVALKYRLDLLNLWDRIDDSARGVTVAENSLLPGSTSPAA